MGIVRWFYFRRSQPPEAGKVYAEIERDVYDVLRHISVTENPDPESSFFNGRGRPQHELEFLGIVLKDSFGVNIPVEDLKSLDTVRKLASYIGRRQDNHIM